MPHFDPKSRKDKAWARYSAARGARRLPAAGRYLKETAAIDDLTKVLDWCRKKRLTVKFTRRSDGIYLAAKREIRVSAGMRSPKQVAVILHECGHFLVPNRQDHLRFGMGYPQTDPNVKRTLAHRISVLEEELEAWHRGWRLAKRLGLSLARKDYDAMRLRCIKSYLQWVLVPGPLVLPDEED